MASSSRPARRNFHRSRRKSACCASSTGSRRLDPWQKVGVGVRVRVRVRVRLGVRVGVRVGVGAGAWLGVGLRVGLQLRWHAHLVQKKVALPYGLVVHEG